MFSEKLIKREVLPLYTSGNLVKAVMGGYQNRRPRFPGCDSADVDAVSPEEEVHDPVVAVRGGQLKSNFTNL